MHFSRTTVLLVKAMKRITTFAFTFLLCALQMLAQIKTGNSRDDITINGIKFGYIYTYDQIKKALGEPTQISTWEATDYGTGFEFRFGNDLTVRMNDDERENDPGIIDFILDSPKYTLDFRGTKLKVGDTFEKVKNMPGYTSREKRYNGFYSIIFNNMMNDHSLQILFSQDEVIECISVAPRYY